MWSKFIHSPVNVIKVLTLKALFPQNFKRLLKIRIALVNKRHFSSRKSIILQSTIHQNTDSPNFLLLSVCLWKIEVFFPTPDSERSVTKHLTELRPPRTYLLPSDLIFIRTKSSRTEIGNSNLISDVPISTGQDECYMDEFSHHWLRRVLQSIYLELKVLLANIQPTTDELKPTFIVVLAAKCSILQ